MGIYIGEFDLRPSTEMRALVGASDRPVRVEGSRPFKWERELLPEGSGVEWSGVYPRL